jgi:hypothetical protein
LARGVDVGVAEEFLDRDDVAPARDQGEGFEGTEFRIGFGGWDN